MIEEHDNSWSTWVGGKRDESTGQTHWEVEKGPVRLDGGPADWRSKRTTRLQLGCRRRTGARVCLEILGPDEAVLGRTTFAADWVGDNDMQLWLANLEPHGDAERWADVRALRMRCVEDGLWPTEITLGPVEVMDCVPTCRVNESDTVIDVSWHHRYTNGLYHYHLMAKVDEWEVVAEESVIPVGEPYRRAPGPWTSFGYQQGEKPGRLVAERKFDMDIQDQSQLLAKMEWDKDSRLTVTAMVDGGREVALLENARSSSWWLTSGADLEGAQRLDSIRLVLEESEDRTMEGREVGMNLLWILLRRHTVLDEAPFESVEVRLAPTDRPHPADVKTVVREVQQVPLAEPPESTAPIGDPLTEGLPIGFYVTREDLPALRERALHGVAKPIFEAIRAEADRALATELVDRSYYCNSYDSGIGHPKGLRGAGMRLFAPTVAITHLITGEEKYAVAARRWILRSARSDDWRADHGGCVDRPQIGEWLGCWDSFTGCYPLGFSGYMMHRFHVADVAFGVVVAYDMLYHCFSPQEREEIEQAFATHGVYVLYDRLYHCRENYVMFNQGMICALPLLMQTALLRERDPVYAQMYDWTLAFIREFGTRVWNEEGVPGEGPGYGIGTVRMYVEALPPLAACTGVSVQEAIPSAIPAIMDYIQHCRSTWSDDRPRFVGFSDGSHNKWVSGEVLAFYANYLRHPVAQYFWDESYAANPPDNLTTLLVLGAGVEPAEPELPPAAVFRDQPMAFLRTGWQHGDTLLAMTNIRQVTGHGHPDRASFVLEYNGEQLLLDPGVPGHDGCEDTLSHNTLTFSQRNQSGGLDAYDTSIAGFLTTSGEHCPGRVGGIDWVAADATAVYPEADKFIRHIIFLRPDTFILYDEVEAKQPETMELNFSCLGPLSAEGDLFISSAQKNRLLIHSQASCALGHRFQKWGTSWDHIPSYRLIRSTAEPVGKCEFLTVLAPHPVESSAPDIAPVEVEGAQGVRISRGDREALVLCGRPGATVAITGVETDARMIVLSRDGGELIGAAMWGGTRLALVKEGEILTAGQPGLVGAVRAEGKWMAQQASSP